MTYRPKDYDPVNDLYVSTTNPFIQKKMHYCDMYDDAAPILNVFIKESEVHFSVDETDYIIDMWAGQYGSTIGGEIGIYKKTRIPQVMSFSER